MKDYKEIAAEVFSRRDRYLVKQKKRRKAIAAAASFCVALCVVIGVSVGYFRLGGGEQVSDTGSTRKEMISLMNTPTVPYTDIDPGSVDEPPYAGTPVYGVPSQPDKDIANKIAADRAGMAKSDTVVYATIERFDAVGTDVLCTLTVEKTLKGDGAKEIYFNISEADRKGFLALIKGEKAVFFLSEGEHGLYLTHGSPSIFYEAGEDDFRSYDQTGLICFNLTMEEIEKLTEAGA